ncbi:MAG: hypothetical protein UT02_C0002G0001 [Parcubacteria group bacterium GW2011_GWC2_38_7]|nr:MAG: hypothetical protein UT02_C0002G0001 [Parcubacteria group bacterium GW2011_GWC2_38_7]
MSNRDDDALDAVLEARMTPRELAAWKVAKVHDYVWRGKRDPEEVADWLQILLSEPHFIQRLKIQRGATMDTEEPRKGWVKIWERFYLEVFGLTVDLSGVALSPYQPGFGWVVYVLKELSLNQLFAKCRDLFPSRSDYGDDLDRKIPTEDRDPRQIGNYARRFRNRVEPDEELKNKSANVLHDEGIAGNTFREATTLELFYFWRTGGHINLVNWNLCAGSRGCDGSVPSVGWSSGCFRVSRGYYPHCSGAYLRARSAV